MAYHHHMAAAIETEAELDLLMKHSSVPLTFDAGHMAFARGDNFRVIENHHTASTMSMSKIFVRMWWMGLTAAAKVFWMR